MNAFNQLDLRQRYNVIVFITLAIAGCLLVLCLTLAFENYANDYTNYYWQEHTGIFAHSVEYSVTLGAKTKSEAIANSFAADKNVLKAAIYTNQHALLANSGKNVDCTTSKQTFTQPFVAEASNHWCFYAPIYQDIPTGGYEQKSANSLPPLFLGYVELVVSKTKLRTLLHQILAVSGLVVFVFLALIFHGVRRFSGTFTQPLVDIIKILDSFAHGNPGGRVAFSGSSELTAMGITFNDMLSRIEENERILEQKIADRTSELKIALENSEAANQYKTQIVATVSHEMKTPLHIIQNCLAASLDALPDTAENELMREFHQRALMRATDLNDLINNILLQGKLEAKSVAVKLMPLDMLPLMQACADKITPYLKRKNNKLKILGKECSIVSDAELLSHIINNLLNNACKFTVDGEITLDWWLDESGLKIQVTDTGCGIPAKFHDKIFESFWQVDMSMGRKYGGTGLGLTVTKQFVELLGGDISVVSSERKGSVFSVKIPESMFR
ncbi:signal transduction histidine-protein kinase BarA [Methyloglobulus morosus KoM1]|uniref:histidine kinase n=1 Tax=Methyloglobulus morosus KoM1 TaxID=1116472 RepID=V5BZM5_9GAMM|nr:HAMP domain-containing sensor histidine kinase [Methyloglobulus morosus]ESS71682.1 signal transduction histidine-protein kinase BarA [Methyloglobulus morosus KoM1]